MAPLKVGVLHHLVLLPLLEEELVKLRGEQPLQERRQHLKVPGGRGLVRAEIARLLAERAGGVDERSLPHGRREVVDGARLAAHVLTAAGHLDHLRNKQERRSGGSPIFNSRISYLLTLSGLMGLEQISQSLRSLRSASWRSFASSTATMASVSA